MRFRKRPVEVDAIRWTGTNYDDILVFCPHAQIVTVEGDKILRIPTLEGRQTAHTGDMIVKGIDGEHYVVKPYVFEQSYEPVEEPS